MDGWMDGWVDRWISNEVGILFLLSAPIPGGCTLTSSIETDPNIKLNFTTYTTTVRFEDGNLGYDPLKVRVILYVCMYMDTYIHTSCFSGHHVG